MTEAEYEKLVGEQLAAAFPRTTDLKGLWAKGGRNSYEHAFKAGVKWSRTHPPPEVVALIDALTYYADENNWYGTLGDSREPRRGLRMVIGSVDTQGPNWIGGHQARAALTRFKERTAGDEGEG